MKSWIALIIALLGTASILAEDRVFAFIDGIPGEVTTRGLEGQVKVVAFNHEVRSPRDSASGLATGKRQHSPVRFVCELGRSTPLLYQALSLNKVIPKIEMSFFRPNPTGDGTEEMYFKIILTNATVSSARAWMPNVKDQSSLPFGSEVEVGFTYQKISWTYTNGGITFEDSWGAQQ
jgi:type VI secretion system secreted protein Hcp